MTTPTDTRLRLRRELASRRADVERAITKYRAVARVGDATPRQLARSAQRLYRAAGRVAAAASWLHDLR